MLGVLVTITYKVPVAEWDPNAFPDTVKYWPVDDFIMATETGTYDHLNNSIRLFELELEMGDLTSLSAYLYQVTFDLAPWQRPDFDPDNQ